MEADDDMRVAEVVTAARAGKPVLLPMDTVYGLCASPYRETDVRRMYRLKGRPEGEPTALVAASLELLFECVPELRGRAGTIARRLLPGPYTLVLPNPARRFRWLTGANAQTIGVRVPNLTSDVHAVLSALGAVAATSANLPGGPDPRTLADVPADIRAGCAAALDCGELPGRSSTVLDFTGDAPVVIREGMGPVEEAVERARAAVG